MYDIEFKEPSFLTLLQVSNLDNGDEFKRERQIREVQDLNNPVQDASLNSDN